MKTKVLFLLGVFALSSSLLARIFYPNPTAVYESPTETMLDSGLSLNRISNTAQQSTLPPPCVHETAQPLGMNQYEISGLAQFHSDPVVIDVIPNTKDPFTTPTLYISEQPISPEAYCAFLNATATSNDSHSLYHQQWNDPIYFPHLLCIAQNGDSVHGFTYTLVNEETNIIATVNGIPTYKTNPPTTNSVTGEIKPGIVEPVYKKIAKRTIMKGVPMTDAARFCNWLSHNQAYGPEGDYTTETGSYTFCETNNYGINGLILLVQKDPHDTSVRELKEVYKSVTRAPYATWRLPSEAEIRDVINNWGNIDTEEVFWSWTDTIYPHCWQTSIAGVSLPFNGAGYRRIKNAPEVFTDRTKLYLYQDLFVSDTGFRVVFTPDNPPASGFRVYVPSITP